MKQYSFLEEFVIPITKEKESHIYKDTVYHSSSIKMSIIKGECTLNSFKRYGTGVVFVSPWKYVSAPYIIDQFLVLNLVCKKNQNIKKNNIKKFSLFNSKINDILSSLSEKQLQTTYPKKWFADMYIEDKDGNQIEFKSFHHNFTGYIHYIDYKKYKDVSYQDHPAPFEFAIKGNVKPFKIEKITIDILINCWKD